MNEFISANFYDLLSVVSYGLIAWSYACTDIKALRVISIVSCLLDLVIYYFIREGKPMYVQIAANLIFLAIHAWHLSNVDSKLKKFLQGNGLRFDRPMTPELPNSVLVYSDQLEDGDFTGPVTIAPLPANNKPSKNTRRRRKKRQFA
jgi:hypothetical protein